MGIVLNENMRRMSPRREDTAVMAGNVGLCASADCDAQPQTDIVALSLPRPNTPKHQETN